MPVKGREMPGCVMKGRSAEGHSGFDLSPWFYVCKCSLGHLSATAPESGWWEKGGSRGTESLFPCDLSQRSVKGQTANILCFGGHYNSGGLCHNDPTLLLHRDSVNGRGGVPRRLH